jgi:[ribosomal protein S5]-alanine N-acetyltransferase
MYSETTNPKSKTHFTLRPFRDGDEASLVENANNIKIFNNVKDTFPHPYTHADAVWWVNANKQSDKPTTCFAIDVDGDAIGAIGIIIGSDIQRVTTEIGYWLGENYWGKGITTEALKRMTDYAFKTFPELVRLWAGVFEYNKSSMQVLEKAGFELEGIRKKGAIKNGVVIDEYVYVKFRE